MYAEAILKKGEGRTLKSGGAWVYDNEIDRVEGDYENGDILAVKDFDGFFLGWGFINTRSKITIRVMSRRKEHEITEEFLENDTSLVVPEGTKEAVLARVREQIRAYEMEQTRKETEEREEAINHLSEEDREALELGRKMLKAGIGQKDPEEPSGKKVRRKKKPLKMYLALAAVIVCVLAMGITSMGGPERIVRMMTQDVGDREVEYTVKGEKVKTIENEDEEKAYQKIRDTFNTDIVKVILCLSDMTFDSMNLEKDKQVAEMYYNYEGKTIAYIINAPYRENSLGIDFEDSVEKEYTKKINGCEIKITIYKIDGEKIPGCVAKFKYNNIEYLLSGTMKQQDFEKIINNLIFP